MRIHRIPAAFLKSVFYVSLFQMLLVMLRDVGAEFTCPFLVWTVNRHSFGTFILQGRHRSYVDQSNCTWTHHVSSDHSKFVSRLHMANVHKHTYTGVVVLTVQSARRTKLNYYKNGRGLEPPKLFLEPISEWGINGR